MRCMQNKAGAPSVDDRHGACVHTYMIQTTDYTYMMARDRRAYASLSVLRTGVLEGKSGVYLGNLVGRIHVVQYAEDDELDKSERGNTVPSQVRWISVRRTRDGDALEQGSYVVCRISDTRQCSV